MTVLRVLFAAAVLVLPNAAALAVDEPNAPVECGIYEGVVCQGWFTDDAGVVGNDQRVEDAIDRLVGRYDRQIAAVIVTDSRGSNPLEFAQALGDSWGVGDAEDRDGVVILVDLSARRTEVTTGEGLPLSATRAGRISGAGNSFFAAGDFEGGMLAIVGSLEQELAVIEAGAGDPESSVEPTEPVADAGGSGGGVGWAVVGLTFMIVALGGTAGYVSNRRTARSLIRGKRDELISGDLAGLEPAGQELPQLEEYAIALDEPTPDVPTRRLIHALGGIDEGETVTDHDAVATGWAAGLVAVIDRDRLLSATEVPFELRATDERPILEDAVQQAAADALAVPLEDDESFAVRRQSLQRVIASLRPHRIAAARRRAATVIVNRLAPTPAGDALLTDEGTRLLRAGAALDPEAPSSQSVDELRRVYASAQRKTARLQDLYDRLPESTTRPAVAAALADLSDEPEDAVSRYDLVHLELEAAGAALHADGLDIPAIAALLLMNNDDEDVDEFVATYQATRKRGLAPDLAVEYALAGLRTEREIDHIRTEARKLDLPVAITAALLRRRDDGPVVYRALADELAGHGVKGETRRTIAGILAISLEPALATRRWLEARAALTALGLEGSYADVAAAFGASDPRGPRVFALAYAAQRQSLARSTIDDADRFAPELAHEGTSRQTDTWTGEQLPRGLHTFDPFTLLFYHWVITRGHHGSYGWEPIYRDRSWSQDRGSWWSGTGGFGGFGGGGGFSGGGGSSWGGSSWSGGGFGGFGGGGGFSGGGGSSW